MRTKLLRPWSVAVLLIAISLAICGCVNLKPVVDTSRYFVLTPLPVPAVTSGQSNSPAVGIGRVEIPDYLQSHQVSFRKSNSEIQYSETLYWAERLDKGIQRVLGANLSSLLSSTNVMLSAWRRSDVRMEVYVSVQRFETDEQGEAVMEARWRVTNPGAEITLRAGTSSVIRPGARLAENPEAATAALSEALAELSREIAAAMRACGANAPGL